MLKKATLTVLIAVVAVFYGILGSEAAQYPKPAGHVNDFAGVMKSGTREQLEGVLRGLASKSGAEVVVVTVKDMGGIDESTYAVELMKEWGIGSKERDDGILILVAVEERRLRIEVGYGLEHVITDAAAGQIRDKYIVPHLRNNDYDTGIRQGALAVASIIAEDMGIELDGTMPVARSPVNRRKPAPFSNFIFILIFF
ncbi:MAG: TPM domain-containing protein, partial [Candidatus Latescibacteria bacterium]|nr:TPM domain-containing protein [Candidatus Latescibacterota bacterium]